MGAAVAGCGDPVRIALLAPLSGSETAEDGRQMVLGAELAVAEINSAGGIDGRQVALVITDTSDQSPATVVRAITNLLGQSSVAAAVTGYASRTAFEVELFADAGIPYLLAEHSLELQRRIAADPGRYALTWCLLPSYDPYGIASAERLASLAERSVPGCRRRVFLITSDNDYANSCAEGLAIGFSKLDWEIAGGCTVPFGPRSDWHEILSAAKYAEPDLLASTDYLPGNAAALTRHFAVSPLRSLLFIQYGPRYPEYRAETGDLADGVIFNVLGGPIPELSATGAIARQFSSAYGLEPNRYGIDVYQEVHLCAEAMTIAGSPDDHLSVGTCLGLAKKDMAEGTLSFDPRTHLARCAADAVPMRWFQFSGARPVCLAPSHLATGSFTVPAWLA